MAGLFDYIAWRGDLPFSQVPLNAVDGLLFSALSYLHFDALVSSDLKQPFTLHTVYQGASALPEALRSRSRADLDLLRDMAQSVRFRDVRLAFYRDKFIPEEETQFAAMAYLLPEGDAFLAFRGTDATLVGWKEDFNMSFQDFVPAQTEASRYLQDFAAAFSGNFSLGGHSKGGNLAVFAAAKCGAPVQARVARVYNFDGPGFSDYLLKDPGYLAIVPKLHSFLPESSIIGMLMEQEGLCRIVKSTQAGIYQHDPYSWEVMGGGFVYAGELSPRARRVDRTIKSWVKDLSREERGRFIDAVYALLTASGASQVHELTQPKNMLAILRALSADEAVRQMLSGEIGELLRAAAAVQREDEP